MKIYRRIFACLLIYLIVTTSIAALWFRFGDSYKYWIITRQPIRTTGIITDRWCNRRGNCKLTFEFSAESRSIRVKQWDFLHAYRKGMPIDVYYRSESPEIAVGGPLDIGRANALGTLWLCSAVFPPLPALLLMWLYFRKLTDENARKIFLSGCCSKNGVECYRYPAFLSLWILCMVVINLASYEIAWRMGFFKENVWSRILLSMMLFAIVTVGLIFHRYRIEISGQTVRTRWLLGWRQFALGEIGRILIVSGRGETLNVFAKTGRRLLEIRSTFNGYRAILGLVTETARANGVQIDVRGRRKHG